MLPAWVTARGHLPLWRWFVLAVLLLAEILWLEFRFDTRLLECEVEWWALLISFAPRLLHVAISSLAAFVLLGGEDLRRALVSHWSKIIEYRGWVRWLVAHLGCYAVFAVASQIVLGRMLREGPARDICATIWLASGLATAVLWVLTVVPPSVVSQIAWSIRRALAVAAGCGLIGWFVGDLANRIWEPLAEGTLWIVTTILRSIYADVVVRTDLYEIGTRSFSIAIAPDCSGYEGIGLMAVFSSVYLWFFRKQLRFPQVLLLLPIGMSAIWLLNAVRIAGLVVIGTSWSPEVALGGFHSQAGWIAFNVVALGLVAATVRIPAFAATNETAGDVPADAPNYTAAYLAPFLTAVAIGMVTGAIAGGFNWLYPLRAVGAVAVLGVMRGALPKWSWLPSWQPIAIGAGVFLIWLALLPSGEADGVPMELRGLSKLGLTGWLVVQFLGYAIVTPIIEELAFRGYLLRRLVSHDFQEVPLTQWAWLGALGSSVLFGALHGANWLAGTAAGFLFAVAAVRRGRIGDAVVAHVAANSLLAAYALTTGNWQAWS